MHRIQDSGFRIQEEKNPSLNPESRILTPGLRPLDSWDALKLLALGLMFIDHSGAFFFTEQMWLRAIGRGAAPIFLFLAGFASSYRIKPEIIALALLLTASDLLLTHQLRTQNILVTIILCRLIFAWLERRGRVIERPHEWVIGALSLLPSIVVVQYGSFGFLFALAGYIKRREALYTPATRARYLALSFIIYGGLTAYLSQFSAINTLIMTATLLIVWRLLNTLQLKPIGEHWPPALASSAKLISYYSAYIYAIHLAALEWISFIPF